MNIELTLEAPAPRKRPPQHFADLSPEERVEAVVAQIGRAHV